MKRNFKENKSRRKIIMMKNSTMKNKKNWKDLILRKKKLNLVNKNNR
jgi:hypothetical protein